MSCRSAPSIEVEPADPPDGPGETGARDMPRQVVSVCLCLSVVAGCCLLLPTQAARADDLPLRKAGLWEMKVVKSGGSSLPDMTMQHCTDETTDKDMSNAVSPMAKQVCSKQDVQKTATGYISDSVCTVAGVAMTSHSEISGDFNSAYTVKTTAHIQRGDKPIDTVTTIEAKWLGACKADQKPGDIVMPGGGFKLNIKDAEKLKGLLPK
jgi:Protein of unknown function (DUF3617)